MKNLMMLLPLALTFAACEGTDDTDTDLGTDADTGMDTESDTGMEAQALVGDWTSEGENVSPLLSSETFDIVEIDASFEADGTYEVTSVDGSGTTVTYTGTYVTDVSTTPATITLTQLTPTEVTSEGIWEVDGTTLTYEVVQTSPDFGFVPPTPEAGFGSTSGPGLVADVNVQVYVAQ